jgi:hypothetical protein
MVQQSINIGSGPNTKDGDPIREAFRKTEENFTDLYNGTGITGIDGGNSGSAYSPGVPQSDSISKTTLKNILDASTTFADFKARIAAL